VGIKEKKLLEIKTGSKIEINPTVKNFDKNWGVK